MKGDVFITIRLRGELPEGVDAQAEAKRLAGLVKDRLNALDESVSPFLVNDAWPQTVRDDRS